MTTRHHAAIALATTGILAASVGFGSSPANASRNTPHHDDRVVPHTAARHPSLSAAQLRDVRTRQRAMIAAHTPAPRLGAGSDGKVKRLTVTTTEDSSLANPSGSRCVDGATGACSLRAAVEAANNRATAVQIVLGAHTYTLTTGAELLVTNPAGTSIVGAGRGRTTLQGAGSRVINESPADPGGPGPLLYLTDLKVRGGTSTDDGGGIYVGAASAGGSLVLDRVTVSGNSAVEYGGGIFTADSATVYADRSTVRGNVARWGAGLFTNWSDVNLTDVDITANHTTDGEDAGGAGWDDEYGVIRMKGGSLSGNTGTAVGGGGLWDDYGNVAFSGVAIDHNTIGGNGSGGGIYAYHDLLEVTGGSISHDTATGDSTAEGGGLYAEGGAQVALHGVTMTHDRVSTTSTASYGGGAINVYGSGAGLQLTIDRKSRISKSNGAAIVAYTVGGQADIEIDGSRLSGNSSTFANAPSGAVCGGAVCAAADSDGSVNLTLNRDTFSGNTSAGTGGAGGVSVWAVGGAAARVHALGSTFTGNLTGGGGLGGALGVTSDSFVSPVSVRSEGNTFTGNEAGTSTVSGNGGAIGLTNDGSFTEHGSTFTQNRARGGGSGGAVYSLTLGSSRFTGSTFTKNSASPTGVGFGGAVVTDDQRGTTYADVTASGNKAGQGGGGLASVSTLGAVSVTGSTLSGNVAGSSSTSGTGGGLFNTAGDLTVTNSTITGNRSVQSSNAADIASGGGISQGNGVLALQYTTVTGNIAPRGGGFFDASEGGAVLGTIVSANHTPGGSEQDCAFAASQDRAHSLGGNVLGQGAACVSALQGSDRVKKSPRLGALAANGGPTRTMALRKNSPAIGRSSFQCPASDQRGRHRPATHCDAGAFELPKVKKHHHR